MIASGIVTTRVPASDLGGPKREPATADLGQLPRGSYGARRQVDITHRRSAPSSLHRRLLNIGQQDERAATLADRLDERVRLHEHGERRLPGGAGE
jgi:hypothetical protein